MPDNRFNRVYLEVQDDEGPRDRLKKIYLNELKKAVEYSEKQSQAVFGRNIPHILWLRCAIATGSFLEDLIEQLQAQGYSFVSFPEALLRSGLQDRRVVRRPFGPLLHRPSGGDPGPAIRSWAR